MSFDEGDEEYDAVSLHENEQTHSSFSSSANGYTYRLQMPEFADDNQNGDQKFPMFRYKQTEQDPISIKQQKTPTRKQNSYKSSGLKFYNNIPDVHMTALPLIKEGCSLEPDMIFGWQPTVECTSPPVPLYFDFVEHQLNCYQFERGKDIIVYQERRAKDSYQVHKLFSGDQQQQQQKHEKEGSKHSLFGQSYQFKFPKFHDNGKFKYDNLLNEIFGDRSEGGAFAIASADSIFGDEQYEFIGMNPVCQIRNKKCEIENKEFDFYVFNSQFESGNIDLVIKTPNGEYDMFIRPDSNSMGNFQWFYFRLQNRLKGSKIKINIVNMTKKNSLYLQGLQVNALSSKKTKFQGVGWHKVGNNIKYTFSKVNKDGQGIYDDDSYQNSNKKCYYQLSFEYEFEFDDDQVYFAYSIPYTYSMTMQFIQDIIQMQKQNIMETSSMDYKIFDYHVLAQSLSGIDVPILTITNNLNDPEKQITKKYIFIVGRIHPGETNSSYVMHGIIKFLLSTDKIANHLREGIVFKIIPMMNPDGVIVGNSRASFIGRDMNRCYLEPNQRLTPEIYHLRKLIAQVQQNDKDKILGFFDIHQHSGRKSIFMYAPYFPLHSRKYLKIRMLPKLLTERSDMFRYYSCKFKYEKYKEGCARLAFYRDFHISYCYTIECSALGFLAKDRETVPFTEESLNEFGICLAHSLSEFIMIKQQDKIQKLELAKQLQKKRKTNKKTIKEILGIKNPHSQPRPIFHYNDRRESPQIINEIKSSKSQSPQRQNHQIQSEERKLTFNICSHHKTKSIQSSIKGFESDHDQEEQASPNQSIKVKFNNPMLQNHGIRQSAIVTIKQPLQMQKQQENPNEADYLNVVDISEDDSLISSESDPNNLIPKLDQQIKMMEQQQQIREQQIRDAKQPFGFEVVDAQELFMQLYNPNYMDWKSTKQKSKIDSQSFEKQNQLQKFYNKKIRTLEEIFYQIKQEMQNEERQQEKEPSQPSQEHYEDLNDEDRKILNKRILGIIDLFNNIGNKKELPYDLQILENIKQETLSNERKALRRSLIIKNRQKQTSFYFDSKITQENLKASESQSKKSQKTVLSPYIRKQQKSINQRPYFARIQMITLDQHVLNKSYYNPEEFDKLYAQILQQNSSNISQINKIQSSFNGGQVNNSYLIGEQASLKYNGNIYDLIHQQKQNASRNIQQEIQTRNRTSNVIPSLDYGRLSVNGSYNNTNNGMNKSVYKLKIDLEHGKSKFQEVIESIDQYQNRDIYQGNIRNIIKSPNILETQQSMSSYVFNKKLNQRNSAKKNNSLQPREQHQFIVVQKSRQQMSHSNTYSTNKKLNASAQINKIVIKDYSLRRNNNNASAIYSANKKIMNDYQMRDQQMAKQSQQIYQSHDLNNNPFKDQTIYITDSESSQNLNFINTNKKLKHQNQRQLKQLATNERLSSRQGERRNRQATNFQQELVYSLRKEIKMDTLKSILNQQSNRKDYQ